MYVYPLRRIVGDIMIGMAGHIATRVVLGEDWTGAYSDFQKIRGHLRHLYMLGYFGPPIHEIGADGSAGKDDAVLLRFWEELDGRVEQLLRAHREELVRLSEELIAHSELSSDEVLAILGSNLQIAASEPASTWAKRLADEPDPVAAPSPAKRRWAKQ